eukprot:CAMPEP_0180629356 /NCGR_PEP_ID=MMETSP1037_2-20121125/39419_1 /TAXON_ID=632150 /ORGANISM="Azadinium spinosum, Strain 3D9" /LENGTH=155 /DNA_ID=CAMNT_0022650155 /DNA_START=451 /DNA_END=916 /DNA_ORIENTATION=+
MALLVRPRCTATAARRRDGAVEGAGAELQALTCVRIDEVPVDLPLIGDRKHGPRDVIAYPDVSSVAHGLATDPGAAPNVEEKASLVLREEQEVQATLSHFRLDLDHAAACRILLGLVIVVEDLGRVLVLRPAAHGSPRCAPKRSKRGVTNERRLE